jgi:ATPase family associated with various cellular activities (AAA)
MTDNTPLSANDFGASFKQFLDQVATTAPSEESVFKSQLRTHFSQDPQMLPIFSQQFETADHPNLQIAFDDYLAQPECSYQLLGVITSPQSYMGGSILSQLVIDAKGGLIGTAQPTPGPVQYKNIALDNDEVLPCVQSGLYLISFESLRLVVLFNDASQTPWRPEVMIEVMAIERQDAENFLAYLRKAIRKRNVYRGKVVSVVEGENKGSYSFQFHHLPSLQRDDIILPSGLLQRIERQTIGFSQVADKLLASGRHLKRGMLLYGPPGTGKTLTAMYLASQMSNRTIILITGRGMGLIEKSCEIARLLQPATLILEDVDLVAEERTRQNTSCNAVLFELLNQMDGLNEDADILFLLTTNRPEALEPALAARPGRVDTAVEIPLPDAICRRRLFELYGNGLSFSLDNLETFIQRTEGVSAAFIRELLRKAALFAAEEGEEIVINDKHLDEALYELVDLGGVLAQNLLGAGKAFS